MRLAVLRRLVTMEEVFEVSVVDEENGEGGHEGEDERRARAKALLLREIEQDWEVADVEEIHEGDEEKGWQETQEVREGGEEKISEGEGGLEEEGEVFVGDRLEKQRCEAEENQGEDWKVTELEEIDEEQELEEGEKVQELLGGVKEQTLEGEKQSFEVEIQEASIIFGSEHEEGFDEGEEEVEKIVICEGEAEGEEEADDPQPQEFEDLQDFVDHALDSDAMTLSEENATIAAPSPAAIDLSPAGYPSAAGSPKEAASKPGVCKHCGCGGGEKRSHLLEVAEPPKKLDENVNEEEDEEEEEINVTDPDEDVVQDEEVICEMSLSETTVATAPRVAFSVNNSLIHHPMTPPGLPSEIDHGVTENSTIAHPVAELPVTPPPPLLERESNPDSIEETTTKQHRNLKRDRFTAKWQIKEDSSSSSSSSMLTNNALRMRAAKRGYNGTVDPWCQKAKRVSLLTSEGPLDVTIVPSKAEKCQDPGCRDLYQCPVPGCTHPVGSRVYISRHFGRDHPDYRSWRDVFINKDAPQFVLLEEHNKDVGANTSASAHNSASEVTYASANIRLQADAGSSAKTDTTADSSQRHSAEEAFDELVGETSESTGASSAESTSAEETPPASVAITSQTQPSWSSVNRTPLCSTLNHTSAFVPVPGQIRQNPLQSLTSLVDSGESRTVSSSQHSQPSSQPQVVKPIGIPAFQVTNSTGQQPQVISPFSQSVVAGQPGVAHVRQPGVAHVGQPAVAHAAQMLPPQGSTSGVTMMPVTSMAGQLLMQNAKQLPVSSAHQQVFHIAPTSCGAASSQEPPQKYKIIQVVVPSRVANQALSLVASAAQQMQIMPAATTAAAVPQAAPAMAMMPMVPQMVPQALPQQISPPQKPGYQFTTPVSPQMMPGQPYLMAPPQGGVSQGVVKPVPVKSPQPTMESQHTQPVQPQPLVQPVQPLQQLQPFQYCFQQIPMQQQQQPFMAQAPFMPPGAVLVPMYPVQ